jgi:hypothetical protein
MRKQGQIAMRPERRSAERLSIAAAVSCSMPGRSLDAIAYDLSTDGCMIEVSNASLKAGDPVVLCFPGQLSIEGRVAWAKYRNAGVQFSGQLDQQVVERIVGVHGRQHAARTRPAERARGEHRSTADDTTEVTLFANSGASSVGGQQYAYAAAVENVFLLAVTVYGVFLLLA